MLDKNHNKKLPTIVVGAGSVGVRFVQELFHNAPSTYIKLFDGENRKPYSRENLSEFLSGKISEDDLSADSKLPDSKFLTTFFNNTIQKIDTKNYLVIDSKGVEHPYKNLVLATGSLPIIPKINGLDLKNVIIFRNLEDAEALLCRQISSRSTVIIGGGQVGLDTASAMNRHNTDVTVIEHRKRLMFQSLDDHASVYLRLYLDDIGINVEVETIVDELKGENGKVTHVVLDDEEEIPCDTVIISIGIKPNISIAQDTDLKISRGIIIDDHLQTNLPGIYAIGECAEHRGLIHTRAEPGHKQAKILAKNLSGRQPKTYSGTTSKTEFKVIDYPFLTIGENGDSPEKRKEVMFRDIKKMTYRKLILKNGHLRGVISAGRWAGGIELEKAVENQKFIWPWQLSRFKETGNLS